MTTDSPDTKPTVKMTTSCALCGHILPTNYAMLNTCPNCGEHLVIRQDAAVRVTLPPIFAEAN